MFDDFDSDLCNKKHYGPVLRTEGDFMVMRCSFCNQIFMNPLKDPAEAEAKKKSSRTCISACNWVTEGNMVRCLSCSYTGPLPFLSSDNETIEEEEHLEEIADSDD